MHYINWPDHIKEEKKNQIITQLYESRSLHNLIDFMAFKAYYARPTKVVEDIIQFVFQQIAKKSPDYILNSYFKDEEGKEGCLKKLIGLGVCIAQREGIGGGRYKDYPKHSHGRSILFASNLNQLSSLSPTEEEEAGGSLHHYGVLVDESTLDEEDQYEKLWKLIRDELSPEQLDDLNYFLTKKKRQGRWRNDELKRRQELLSRIEEIVTNSKIHIYSRKVIQLDGETGEEIQTFSSVQRASKVTGIKSIEITQSCADKSQKKIAGGFRWMYQPIIKL